MKIAFLVTGLDAPSTRYRVLKYLPYLEESGFLPEVYEIPRNFWERQKLFRKMKRYDVVFLQKKLFTAFDFHILRGQARRLVYDFDDALMFRDSNNREQLSKTRESKFSRTVKKADLVIAGNKYLMEIASAGNSNTSVVPTSLDLDRYGMKPASDDDGTITLGWIGSRSTLFYLDRIGSVLDRVADTFKDVKLKIVCDRFLDLEKMPVFKKEWKYDDEIHDLHSFHIGLMPLTDDPWSRGKCGFKLLQYMAVGVPAVASPVGVNSEIVSDGVNGFLAETEDEWIEKVGELINNRSLRDDMGRKARETVENFYTIEKNSRIMVDLLRGKQG